MSAVKFLKHNIAYFFFFLLLVLPFGMLMSGNFALGYVALLIIVFSGVSFIFTLPQKYFRFELSVFYIQVLYAMYSLSIFPFGSSIQNAALVIFPVLIMAYAIQNFKFDKFFQLQIFLKKDIKWFLLFLILFLGSVIRNRDDYTNIYAIIKVFGFFTFFFFYVLVVSKSFLNNRDVFNAFLKFLVIFGACMGIIGIFSYFVLLANVQRAGMAAGLFISPNTLGYFLVTCISITLSIILFKKPEPGDLSIRVLTICFFTMLIAEVLTLSRTSWISFIFALSIVIFFRSKKLFVGFAILGGVLFSLFITILDTVKGSGSFLSRIGLWYSAIELFNSSKDGFLFGFGAINSFIEFQKYKILLPGLYDSVNYPHNILLFFIMQFGLFCLIALVIYIFRYLYKAAKLISVTKNNNFALLVSFIFCSTILIQSMFEDMLLFPNYFIYPIFLTFFGILRYSVNGYVQKS